MTARPDWQLPEGVPRGTWEYGQSELVTGGYDEDLAGHPLFSFDEQVLNRWLVSPQPGEEQIVADLGCGTGRAILNLARRGFHGLAIDLSEKMLEQVQRRAANENLSVHCLRANLVELQCLADESVDHAVQLFSTLGMIQGRSNRQQVLSHTCRILKPGGIFILHVHNYWYNLYDPGGPWWLISNWLRSRLGSSVEQGDKFFSFRDVSRMYLHVFTAGELKRALTGVGFQILEWIPLAPKRLSELRLRWLLSSLRANGWIVVCQKP